MKERNKLKKAIKIVLWISLAYVCFVGIDTAFDVFGYTPFHGTTFLTYLHFRRTCSENSTSQTNANRSTTRKTNVAFLKVHKAGSSCVQNLLFRFGLRHNLNILLPKSENYLYSENQKLPLKPCEHYNIFACHTVYRKQLFDDLLPDDSVTIGIVREPVSRVISAAYYYRDVMNSEYLNQIPRANFIHNLVNLPETYERNFFSHTRNTMGQDFGFPNDIKQSNAAEIRKYLDELNSQFLLVLIMEKFNESLVLMKRLLNWSFLDIIYMKSNSHEHYRTNLNETERAKFRTTSFLDFEIYEYFFSVFDIKLKQIEDDFYDEVSYFKTVIDKVSEFCLRKEDTKNVTLLIQQSKWDSAFKVSETDCQWMQTEEVEFINKLREQRLQSV